MIRRAAWAVPALLCLTLIPLHAVSAASVTIGSEETSAGEPFCVG
jgi:hypothetical protein